VAAGIRPARGFLKRGRDPCIGAVGTEGEVSNSLLAVFEDRCKPPVDVQETLRRRKV
jgi:hypothetical protein